MTMRVIDEGVYSEPMHHALDQVLLDRLDRGEIEPTVRFWYRKNRAVPLGRFQAHDDEVAADYVTDQGIDVVRRITGGGAMYVEPGNVITYSLYLPEEDVPEDIEESYAVLDEWVLEGLRDMGLEAHHEPLNDISHPEGKIGGSAQLRSGSAVLHHTTMSYALDIESMLKVLRIGKEKVSDKAVKSAEKRVARIADHVDEPRETVIESLKTAIDTHFGATSGSLDEATVEAARDLVETKFQTDTWNRRL
ncbi:lipoate--protein ligase family protein [Halodesulfurarchaeum formicicum]|uniref:Lipoate-protein ligase n=1 Tax=Halodesulfurarchaeum formicicum TaxID=1873524 RepID=A0A1J1AF15_9EURY|nr:biotin/lipoate A/B protein ligase family protein [Halodesulfurarchaeum formicicum]APE96185.1 lipoate-protein ligase [Halodesulfurarchaeum formicicum]